MRGQATVAVLCISSFALAAEEPEGLRERFVTRVKADLERVSDFVCLQTSERFRRMGAENGWQKIDTVRFEVALVGDQELYSLPGARRFERRPLGDLVAKGSISTGQLGLMAKHVFTNSRAQLNYKGEGEQKGRRAHEYGYDVPPNLSNYHLRMGKSDAVVGFQGSFWIDAETLDLLRLEVQAYDIPDSLGLAQADTVLDYSRVPLDGVDMLLPLSATLSVAATNGDENMNRAGFSGCRRYQSESTIRFDTAEASGSGGADRTVPHKFSIPVGTLLELTLNAAVDPATAQLGDAIKATVVRAAKAGDQVAVPPGAVVSGRVVRLEKLMLPVARYQIGFEFDSIVINGQVLPVMATMEDAGPAAGLLLQAKSLDPASRRRRSDHIGMLVREVQSGQGILDWDAGHAPIPKGLRMRWRVQQ